MQNCLRVFMLLRLSLDGGGSKGSVISHETFTNKVDFETSSFVTVFSA